MLQIHFSLFHALFVIGHEAIKWLKLFYNKIICIVLYAWLLRLDKQNPLSDRAIFPNKWLVWRFLDVRLIYIWFLLQRGLLYATSNFTLPCHVISAGRWSEIPGRVWVVNKLLIMFRKSSRVLSVNSMLQTSDSQTQTWDLVSSPSPGSDYRWLTTRKRCLCEISEISLD